MRKLTFLAGALIALVLTACGKKAPVLYDKEGFKETIALFNDSPVKDKEFLLVYFQSEKALEDNTLHFGRFIYPDNDKMVKQEFNFPKEWKDATALDNVKKEGEFFKLKDINTDKVVEKVKEGIEKFKDEFPDYENFNVSCIFLESDGTAGGYKVGFRMEFTEIGKGKSYQRIGRKTTVTTTYYRVLAEQKGGEWTFESEEK